MLRTIFSTWIGISYQISEERASHHQSQFEVGPNCLGIPTALEVPSLYSHRIHRSSIRQVDTSCHYNSNILRRLDRIRDLDIIFQAVVLFRYLHIFYFEDKKLDKEFSSQIGEIHMGSSYSKPLEMR